MRVAVAGAGKVGRAIARELVGNGHDVLLIDKDAELARPGVVDGAGSLLADACEVSALDEARPAQELMELVRSTAAEAGPPSLHKPHKNTEPEEEGAEDEAPSQELLLVRAFRKAVREAGNTFDGTDEGSVDFDAAFAALAGGGVVSAARSVAGGLSMCMWIGVCAQIRANGAVIGKTYRPVRCRGDPCS